VKLLFDQNISRRIVDNLSDPFPGCAHISQFDLSEADDGEVWDFASERGYTIVSKDADFHQRSFLFGAPPKVIWVRLGNCSTREIEELLRKRSQDISTFLADPQEAFLALA